MDLRIALTDLLRENHEKPLHCLTFAYTAFQSTKPENMYRLLLIIIMAIPSAIIAQVPLTPSESIDFTKVTAYNEIAPFLSNTQKVSPFLKLPVIGQSVNKRNIHAVTFSSGEFGKDSTKVKVLMFAQQHGNEQSGKEAALLLIRELTRPENHYLLSRLDIAIIPQVNPDGSELNQRRNASQADLNRNHLILTEPETKALHAFFDQFLFEVTLDVHEYSPYSDEWMNEGFRKNTLVALGAPTNLNVSEKIRNFAANKTLPFVMNQLSLNNYSSFVYCPGDPPGKGYLRHSTFDINDGRQSFAIQQTLSFIQEGMNGTDNYIQNLKQRSLSQMAGMRSLLEFSYTNRDEILKIVNDERKALVQGSVTAGISIQSTHAGNGQQLQLPVLSVKTGRDSTLTITDYRPVVRSLTEVKKPVAYLVPDDLTEVLDWAERQKLTRKPYKPAPTDRIERAFVQRIDSIDFEGDTVVNPGLEPQIFSPEEISKTYIEIPTNQLKGLMVAIALEPKSMLGLVTYDKYRHLLRDLTWFPILKLYR